MRAIKLNETRIFWFTFVGVNLLAGFLSLVVSTVVVLFRLDHLRLMWQFGFIAIIAPFLIAFQWRLLAFLPRRSQDDPGLIVPRRILAILGYNFWMLLFVVFAAEGHFGVVCLCFTLIAIWGIAGSNMALPYLMKRVKKR